MTFVSSTNGEIKINETVIEDTFAEAFKMWGTRLIVTAPTPYWALQAGQAATGFATSVIGCGCEAGIEAALEGDETPDGRPGVSLLFFGGYNDLEKQLLNRTGQAIMTCPGTACYRGIPDGEGYVSLGGALRYFGDTFQNSKVIGGIRYWRIPVMDGEFLVEDKVPLRRAIGGGNFLILAEDEESALEAAQNAVSAMRKIKNIILPFPGGVVRSGSKVGSKYKFLGASSNTNYCPTLRAVTESNLSEDVACVLEIVVDGLNEDSIKQSMKVGILAACEANSKNFKKIKKISAGNYGGNLGPFHFHLKELFSEGEF